MASSVNLSENLCLIPMEMWLLLRFDVSVRLLPSILLRQSQVHVSLQRTIDVVPVTLFKLSQTAEN